MIFSGILCGEKINGGYQARPRKTAFARLVFGGEAICPADQTAMV